MTKDTTLSAGAQALRASGKTATEIGRIAHKTRQAATKWLNDLSTPDDEAQLLLEAAGLATRAQWCGEVAGDGQGGGNVKEASRTPTVPEPVQVHGSTRDALVAQRGRLEGLLATPLPTGQRVDAERALSATLVALQRLDGTQITESTIVRHPCTKQVLGAVLAALEPWPDAVRAVAEALHARAG